MVYRDFQSELDKHDTLVHNVIQSPDIYDAKLWTEDMYQKGLERVTFALGYHSYNLS